MSRALQRLSALALLVALIAAGFGTVRWLSLGLESGPSPSGTAQIAALSGVVRIVRDPFGVPHVDAEAGADGWVGLGFAHAQDRLWQMEVQRRAALGTLSEIFGRSTLPADRLARTLDLGGAAQRESTALRGEVREVLQAYCLGVNRWIELIAEGAAPRPFELRWLEIEPAPWTPAHVLAIVRLRAWNTARSLSAALLLDKLVRELGGLSSKDFFPQLGGETQAAAQRMLSWAGAADQLARVSDMSGPTGSLGFVVGAERSASGAPILANDPHVGFGLPAKFYLAHVRTPAWELGGATWPGVPVFWTGTNGRAAWGQVALHASVSDLFDETFHPDDPLRYERGGRWTQAVRREESIAVRGQPQETLEVLSTRNGPLLTTAAGGETRALALRWTGQAESSGIGALLAAQRARSWGRFRQALRPLPAPPATFLYADSRSTIGRQVAGRLPVRAIETGLLPVTGGSQYYAWRGLVAYDDLPSDSGKDLPHLVASTHPADPALARRVTWLWRNPGGARRLEARLQNGGRLALRDALELQRERRSWRGPDKLRQLLRSPRPQSRSAARVREALLAWDGSSAVESPGAALYHVFRQRLTFRVLESEVPAAEMPELIDIAEPAPGLMLARFLDRVGPRRAGRLADAALEDTWSFMRTRVSSNPAKWTWGQTHQLSARHAFERWGTGLLGLVGRRLGRGPFPAPGDPDSVWAMFHTALPTRDVAVGPGVRYAVDLADPRHAQVGLAGGQSGYAASPYYDDALSDWLIGRPRPLWMHWEDVAYYQIGVWELQPPSG